MPADEAPNEAANVGCHVALFRQVPTPAFNHREFFLVLGEESMSSINKVILIGRLGKDPEVKYTPSGAPVAKFTLATDEVFKDRSGEQQRRTEWHNIVAWNRLSEICG